VPVTGVPEQIEDEEHEQRLERVAAIDVAKASGKLCTPVPHESKAGKRVTWRGTYQPPPTRVFGRRLFG
jgi:transposase